MMPHELPAAIYERITHLSALGDVLAREKKYDDAIKRYQEAWDLLPEPKTAWKAASWLLTAIGDANFFSNRFDTCIEVFGRAIVHGVGGLGNPFLHLRLGESLFERGRLGEAADELMRAYMGGGADIFGTEDPKYLQYLKTIAQL